MLSYLNFSQNLGTDSWWVFLMFSSIYEPFVINSEGILIGIERRLLLILIGFI